MRNDEHEISDNRPKNRTVITAEKSAIFDEPKLVRVLAFPNSGALVLRRFDSRLYKDRRVSSGLVFRKIGAEEIRKLVRTIHAHRSSSILRSPMADVWPRFYRRSNLLHLSAPRARVRKINTPKEYYAEILDFSHFSCINSVFDAN